jgi:hypothetical protein
MNKAKTQRKNTSATNSLLHQNFRHLIPKGIGGNANQLAKRSRSIRSKRIKRAMSAKIPPYVTITKVAKSFVSLQNNPEKMLLIVKNIETSLMQ